MCKDVEGGLSILIEAVLMQRAEAYLGGPGASRVTKTDKEVGRQTRSWEQFRCARVGREAADEA
jgi:hypothetical protein